MRLVGFVLGSALAVPAFAIEPQTKFSGNTPVAVSGLSERNGCYPHRMAGRVAARKFDESGVVLQSVTIEDGTGERTFINVDTNVIAQANAADRTNALRGLQIVLREGARVRLDVYACGAAGRVIMLESVAIAR